MIPELFSIILRFALDGFGKNSQSDSVKTETATHIRFSHSHSTGETVTFNAAIHAYRIVDRAICVIIPARVAALKFAPFGGKRIVWVKPSVISSGIVKNA